MFVIDGSQGISFLPYTRTCNCLSRSVVISFFVTRKIHNLSLFNSSAQQSIFLKHRSHKYYHFYKIFLSWQNRRRISWPRLLAQSKEYQDVFHQHEPVNFHKQIVKRTFWKIVLEPKYYYHHNFLITSLYYYHYPYYYYYYYNHHHHYYFYYRYTCQGHNIYQKESRIGNRITKHFV